MRTDFINVQNDNIEVEIPDFVGRKAKSKLHWLQVFDYASSLFAGGFTSKETGGSGIWLFKVDTKTGKFTPLVNLLEDEGDAKLIRNHLGI